MKAKLYTGRQCITKVDSERVFHSQNTGQQWIDVALLILETPDRFGNEVIIQHRGHNGDEHIIIGNAKFHSEIDYVFPSTKKVPSKMDYRVEKASTDINFEDLP